MDSDLKKEAMRLSINDRPNARSAAKRCQETQYVMFSLSKIVFQLFGFLFQLPVRRAK